MSQKALPFYLLLTFLMLAGCGEGPSEISSAFENKELIVLTRNAPTSYYFDREGREAGMEYDLITAFADAHNLNVKFKVLDTVEEIFSELKAGKAHIAAAGLTDILTRKQSFLTSTPYQTVSQQVVCRRKGKQAKSFDDLSSVELAVISHSSYENQLSSLKEKNPNLYWETNNGVDTETLLEMVWKKEIDCTIADSNILAINRRYHPELITHFDLVNNENLVWYLPHSETKLQTQINQWLAEYKKDGHLDILLDRYYGFIEIFDYVDTRKYINRIKERLPKYQETFQQAASQYQLPWTLLAAQAYQESHWNPKAKSPTGVRGIMMLTQTTAKEVGVTHRLDPTQSILGGAKYLEKLKKRLPEEITEPDRTWFALAAYNVGMGHLKDARKLASRLEKNPNLWNDLKEVLPLLSKKKYYKTLKYGYARGNEPVTYVKRIRNFEDILKSVTKE